MVNPCVLSFAPFLRGREFGPDRAFEEFKLTTALMMFCGYLQLVMIAPFVDSLSGLGLRLVGGIPDRTPEVGHSNDRISTLGCQSKTDWLVD